MTHATPKTMEPVPVTQADRRYGGGLANEMRALGYTVSPPSDPEDCSSWTMKPPGEGNQVWLAKDEAEGWEKASEHWHETAAAKSLSRIAATTLPDARADGLAEQVAKFTPGFMGAVVAAMSARVLETYQLELRKQRGADFVLAQELADTMPRILARLRTSTPQPAEAREAQLEAQPSLVEREVLRLVVMHDDGEHEPHEAEQCGIFTSIEDVHAYVERRFADTAFKADMRPSGEAWHLIDRETGKDSDLVLIVRHETLYAPAPLQPAPDQVEALREARTALDLARNRLNACTVAAIAWGKTREQYEWGEWTAEAGASIDRIDAALAAMDGQRKDLSGPKPRDGSMAEQTTPPDVGELVERARSEMGTFERCSAVTCSALIEALTTLAAENERLNERVVETNMLAYKWMEAHFKLLAGKPYSFPKPADVPECIAERDALAAEKAQIVEWLREQSDKGADWALEREKGTTARAAYGGGSYALKVAADAIERGDHKQNGGV